MTLVSAPSSLSVTGHATFYLPHHQVYPLLVMTLVSAPSSLSVTGHATFYLPHHQVYPLLVMTLVSAPSSLSVTGHATFYLPHHQVYPLLVMTLVSAPSSLSVTGHATFYLPHHQVYPLLVMPLLPAPSSSLSVSGHATFICPAIIKFIRYCMVMTLLSVRPSSSLSVFFVCFFICYWSWHFYLPHHWSSLFVTGHYTFICPSLIAFIRYWSFPHNTLCRSTRLTSSGVKLKAPEANDDDELMLNVLRCHETY